MKKSILKSWISNLKNPNSKENRITRQTLSIIVAALVLTMSFLFAPVIAMAEGDSGGDAGSGGGGGTGSGGGGGRESSASDRSAGASSKETSADGGVSRDASRAGDTASAGEVGATSAEIAASRSLSSGKGFAGMGGGENKDFSFGADGTLQSNSGLVGGLSGATSAAATPASRSLSSGKGFAGIGGGENKDFSFGADGTLQSNSGLAGGLSGATSAARTPTSTGQSNLADGDSQLVQVPTNTAPGAPILQGRNVNLDFGGELSRSNPPDGDSQLVEVPKNTAPGAPILQGTNVNLANDGWTNRIVDPETGYIYKQKVNSNAVDGKEYATFKPDGTQNKEADFIGADGETYKIISSRQSPGEEKIEIFNSIGKSLGSINTGAYGSKVEGKAFDPDDSPFLKNPNSIANQWLNSAEKANNLGSKVPNVASSGKLSGGGSDVPGSGYSSVPTSRIGRIQPATSPTRESPVLNEGVEPTRSGNVASSTNNSTDPSIAHATAAANSVAEKANEFLEALNKLFNDPKRATLQSKPTSRLPSFTGTTRSDPSRPGESNDIEMRNRVNRTN